LELLDEIEKQRWDNIIEFIRSQGRIPSANSKDDFKKSLGITLNHYKAKKTKKGLDSEQEENLKKLL